MTQNNLTGQTLGEYNLEQILGKGSVATVYKATNANAEPVAFKLLTPKYGTSSRAVQVRFEREAKAIALRGLERHPDEAILRYNLACYMSLLGEMDEAKGELRRSKLKVSMGRRGLAWSRCIGWSEG